MESGRRWAYKLEHATAYLRNRVQDASSLGTMRLPTIRILARDAGVSLVTMHRAVQILGDEHLLDVLPRRGIHIRLPGDSVEACAPSANAPPCTEPRWRQLKAAITEDIMRGTFAPGSMLPTKSELCDRYGTCSRTLGEALKCLVDEDKLRRCRRGYRVYSRSAGSHMHSSGTVVLIAQHDMIHVVASRMSCLPEFFTAFEREQLRRGFRMKLVSSMSFFDRGTVRKQFTFASLEASFTVLGYVILTTSMSHQELTSLLEEIRHTGKPVALLDDSGYSARTEMRRNANLRVFEIQCHSPAPGITVANHLLAQGHRRIAYFHDGSGSSWSRKRLEGLAAAIQPRGTERFVKAFATVSSSPEADSGTTVWSPADGVPDLNALPRLERLYIMGRYQQARMGAWYVHRGMKAAFDAALEDTAITAWVGANDRIALMAYFYLRNNNREPSRDIAVAGFDNSFESTAYGISSFCFNHPAALSAALDYIFSPSATRVKEGITHVAVPGILWERASTAMTNRD